LAENRRIEQTLAERLEPRTPSLLRYSAAESPLDDAAQPFVARDAQKRTPRILLLELVWLGATPQQTRLLQQASQGWKEQHCLTEGPSPNHFRTRLCQIAASALTAENCCRVEDL